MSAAKKMKKDETAQVVNVDGYTTQHSKKIKEMRLSDLPSELIAQIAGRLEYSDVRNLMKTNKRICAAIREHKKDKMRPYDLKFSDYPSFKCVAYGDADTISDRFTVEKQYIFDNRRLGTNVADNIAHIISECSHIHYISFRQMIHLNSDIINMLNRSKAKIRTISVDRSGIECSIDEFITFCQKFGTCLIKYSSIPYNFYTDDVFEKILPHIELEDHEEHSFHGCRMELTDRTLMKVFECASDFEIPGFMTSFTVEGIVKGLQMPLNKNEKHSRLFFLLGYLDFDQLEAADHYFNKDTGELKDLYEIEVSESNGYDYDYRERTYNIQWDKPDTNYVNFSVHIPTEVVYDFDQE